MSNIGPMLEALASDPQGAAAYEALLQSLASGRAQSGQPGEPVLLGFYGGGRLAAGSVLGRVMVTVRSVIPGFQGSLAAVGTPPTAPATFTITLRRAGQEQTIGQLTFDTAGNPQFQMLPVGARSVRLEPGDVVSVIAPATQDAQLADVNVVIRTLPWEDARSQAPRRGLAQNTQSITLVAPAPYNQDLIPDGPTFRRLVGVSTDNKIHTATPLLPQGSTPPVGTGVTVSVTVNSTPAIVVSWGAGTIYYPDGTSDSIASGSQTFTTWAGQPVQYPPAPASGTNYYHYTGNVCWNYNTKQVVIQQTGGAILTQTTTNQNTTQTRSQAYGDGLVPLLIGFDVYTSTASGGGGSGGGGGGGSSCPIDGTQIVPLGQHAHGTSFLNDEWVTIETDNGCRLTATPSHPVYTDRAGKTPLAEVVEGDFVVTRAGSARVVRVERERFPAQAVRVEMHTGHLYWANGILSHNVKII
jgi:hypothetical protein